MRSSQPQDAEVLRSVPSVDTLLDRMAAGALFHPAVLSD
jgi:hypothetical protein